MSWIVNSNAKGDSYGPGVLGAALDHWKLHTLLHDTRAPLPPVKIAVKHFYACEKCM